MNRINCPTCRHRLKYSDNYAGKKAKCQHCGTSFRLPVADEAYESGASDPEFVFDWGEDRPTVATYKASPDAVWKAIVDYFAGLPAWKVLSKNSNKRELVCKNEELGLLVVFGVSGNEEESDVHYAFNDKEVPPAKLAKHPEGLLQKVPCAALIALHLNKKFRQASAGCAVVLATILGLGWTACVAAVLLVINLR